MWDYLWQLLDKWDQSEGRLLHRLSLGRLHQMPRHPAGQHLLPSAPQQARTMVCHPPTPDGNLEGRGVQIADQFALPHVKQKMCVLAMHRLCWNVRCHLGVRTKCQPDKMPTKSWHFVQTFYCGWHFVRPNFWSAFCPNHLNMFWHFVRIMNNVIIWVSVSEALYSK